MTFELLESFATAQPASARRARLRPCDTRAWTRLAAEELGMAALDAASGEGSVWSAELNRRQFLGGVVLGAGMVVAAQLPLTRVAAAEVPVHLNPTAPRPDA